MNDMKSLMKLFESIENSSDEKPAAPGKKCDCNSYDCTVCYPDDVVEEDIATVTDDEDEDETVVETIGGYKNDDFDDGLDDDFVDDDLVGSEAPLKLRDIPDEVNEPGTSYGSEDVSGMIAQIEELQASGQSQSDRMYDIEKLMKMKSGMVRRIYDKVVGETVTENSADPMDPDNTDEFAYVPERGASEDVSELIAQIEYVQDMGISNASQHYSTEQLVGLSSDAVRRIYHRVVGNETMNMAESANVIVDRDRGDGQIIVKHNHSRVKVVRSGSGFNIVKMAGGLIDQAVSEEDALGIASQYLLSGEALTESKIVFRNAAAADAALQALDMYGYDIRRVDQVTLDVDAPEIVVDKIADMHGATSVQYAYEDTGAGSVSVAPPQNI